MQEADPDGERCAPRTFGDGTAMSYIRTVTVKAGSSAIEVPSDELSTKPSRNVDHVDVTVAKVQTKDSSSKGFNGSGPSVRIHPPRP